MWPTSCGYAKRIDDEERFYRETVQGATQVGQMAGAIEVAGRRRGGADPALRALRSLANRPVLGRIHNCFLRICTVASHQRGNGSLCRAEGIFPGIQAARLQRGSRETGERAADARRGRPPLPGSAIGDLQRQGVVRQIIFVGSRYIITSIDYPQDNEYLDGPVISTLRSAFEIFKRDDLASDLVNHFRRQAGAAHTPAEAIYPRLALSAVIWWGDEKDEAIAELEKVVAASRPESDLRVDLADLLARQGSPADSLELLDAVQPLDNMSLKRPEELAISAAIVTGNTDRARHGPNGCSACDWIRTRRSGFRARCGSSGCPSWRTRCSGVPSSAPAGRARP